MPGKSCWNVVSWNTYTYETCNIYIFWDSSVEQDSGLSCHALCINVLHSAYMSVLYVAYVYVVHDIIESCLTAESHVMPHIYMSYISHICVCVCDISYMCMWYMCYTSLYVYVARRIYVLQVVYMYVLHDTTESCSTVESHVMPHIYMCYTSDLCVCYTSDICVCYKILQSCSFIVSHIMPHIHMCYMSRICMCYTTLESSMTRAYVWHDDVFLRVTCHRGECRCWHFSSSWLIHICNMTCS